MVRPRYTDEQVREAVASSTSWAEVCRKIGIKPATGSQSNMSKRAKAMGLDHSHFLGQGWNKGRNFGPKRPLEDYLSNRASIHSHALRRRLIGEGYKEEKCEMCGLTEWMGQPIPLELDHINSDHFDNRLENLQIVCPTCHAVATRQRGAVAKLANAGALGASSRVGSSPTSPTVRLCMDCYTSINRRANRCKSCSRKADRSRFKAVWPSDAKLLAMVCSMPMTSVARELGVSDVAIRKRLRRIGVT